MIYNKHLKFFFIFCFTCIFFVNFSFSSIFIDNTNSKLTLKTIPKRIISLSPYVTEIIFKLGKSNNIVGVTSFCNRPIKAQLKPKVGGIINPNIEIVLALSPDIIFATKEDQSNEEVMKLRKLGLNVFVLKECKSFVDIKENFLLISRILGEGNKAKKILFNIETKLEAIKKKCFLNKTKKVFFMIESNPIISVSRSTFFASMLFFINAQNIVETKVPRYPIFSQEKLLLLKPNFVICMTKENQNILHLKTLMKKSKFIYVNPDIFLRANPFAFCEAVEILNSKIMEKDSE